MIRCVAFDFDNTLVRSETAKRRSFYDVVDASLHDALDEFLARRPLPDRFQTFALLAEHAGVTDQGEAWAKEYSDLADQRIAVCPEILGAGDTIRALAARDVHMAIISDTPQEPLEKAVSARPWAGQIDAVRGKPTAKADHLAEIAAEQGVDPRQMVMVGDRDGDRAAAEAVGARFVQIDFDDPGVGANDRPDGHGWPVLVDLTGLVQVIDRFE